MTLQTPFDQFPAAVRRFCAGAPVFVAPSGGSTLATAADPATGVLVMSLDRREVGKTREYLKTQGFEVLDGSWSTASGGGLDHEATTLYVAAVAYKSKDDVPGLWVDAFAELPTQAAVLKALFEDFKATGTLADVSFEEFVRLASPNVVVTTPEQLIGFAAAQDGG